MSSLESLIIEGTINTPTIVFDTEKLNFQISGKSMPEDAVDFDATELESIVRVHGGQMLTMKLLEAIKEDVKNKGTQRRKCYVVCWGGAPRLELNPTLSMLRTAAEQVDAEDETHPVTKERIHNMLEFVETTSGWYEQINDIPTSTLRKLMKLGRKITKLVS